jgi:chromate transporter
VDGNDGGDRPEPDEEPSSRAPHQPEYAAEAATLGALAALFGKLGLVAFGGPVAHIAIMEREVVERRRWVSRRHFVDLIGATNLLPGPNSTQMTMHVGYVQRGDVGLWVAGWAFILPAVAVTLALTWAYVAFRELPAVEAAFHGIQPVVVAVIAAAMWSLAPKAARGAVPVAVAVAAFLLGVVGVNELLVLAAGGLAGLLAFRVVPALRDGGGALLLPPLLADPGWSSGVVAQAGGGQGGDVLGQLAWLFFKFGVTLFGSGYLLIAYLQGDLVDRIGLLTTGQLVDAIVIGEMTPGPLFTVSTAAGYLIAGWPGGLVATAAIFLPSFGLAMLLGRFMPAIKGSAAAAAALKGLTAAVLGVMLAVSVELAQRVVVDVVTGAVAVVALLLLVRFKVSPIVLVPAGALVGLVAFALT